VQAVCNISANPQIGSKIQYRKYGLGGRHEVVDAQYSPEKKGSMSVRGIQSWVDPKLTYWDETIEVKDVVEEWAFLGSEDRNVFVKLDCEGAEYDIVSCLASSGIMKYIYGFVIEWHEHGDKELIDILHINGFASYCRTHPQGHVGLIYAFRVI
jgi:hypothetical protein